MTVTAYTIITRALRLIGALGTGETPTDDEAADGLLTLNDLIDQWRAERITIPVVARNLFPLTLGVQLYTIGTGGAFNVARPLDIQDAGLVDTSGYEFEMTMLSDDEYAAWGLKSQTSNIPLAGYYDHSFPLGNLRFLPTPNQGGLQVALYLPTASITEFADLVTEYDLGPSYSKAIRYNLAVDLGPEYPDADVTGEIKDIARNAYETLAAANDRFNLLKADPALCHPRGGAYNIYTDGQR